MLWVVSVSVERLIDSVRLIVNWTSCGLERTAVWSISCGLWYSEMLFCPVLGFFAVDRQNSVRLSSRNPAPF